MEHLPQTKGKGVMMFAKRRQRMDELSAEQEEMTQKGMPVETIVEPVGEILKHPQQEESTQDVYERQQEQFQEQIIQQQMLPQSANGMNGLDPRTVLRPLVPNRTAKPFLGGHNQGQKTFSPVRGVSSPTPKKPENIFKVPVPVNRIPQVWSPTSDIIASRDERISVPAIKTRILPETKRRGTSKTDSKEMQQLQKKGDQKSITESVPEEDFLSLGAEACNFMQAPKIKQKNPPPVLPKPVINPAHPPWSAEGCVISRSPLAASSTVPVLGHTQVKAVPQQNPPKLQSAGNSQPSLSSQPISKQASPFWVPSHSPDLHQSAWTPEPHQAQHKPDLLHAGPSQSKKSSIRSQNDGNSVASCPSQHLGTYVQASKAPLASPKGNPVDTGTSDGLKLKGKGAELFARRQSRMEKFVVDDETVQANKARSSSPTLSMPSTWKYSPNVRAPPPVSYNPILSPFYPLAAVKQPPPASSPKIKPKASKEKMNPSPKHLNVLDVMKHQPYQLNSSLFTYNSTLEAKEAVSPKESKLTSNQTPDSFQNQSYEPSSTFSPSPNSFSKGSQPVLKQSKAIGEGFSRSSSLSFSHRLPSVSPVFPVPTLGVNPACVSLNRQYSWVEQPQNSPPPKEAVAQCPFVDEVKMSATHRKSLPETPAEWKQRILYELVGGPQEMAPVIAVTSPTKNISPVPKKPVVYGLPFHQPLVTRNRYSRSSSQPSSFTLDTNYPQLHRISWKL